MKTIVVAAALIASLAPVALAHDTWMMCKPARIKSGDTVALHVTTGMAFPALDFAPDPARIANCEWRIGGKQGAFDSFDRQANSLVVSGRVTTDGVAVVYAMFKPTELLLNVHHDEDAKVYLNGQLIAELPGFVGNYETVSLDSRARQALKPGRNVLAVSCRQTRGGQYIDVGLEDAAD